MPAWSQTLVDREWRSDGPNERAEMTATPSRPWVARVAATVAVAALVCTGLYLAVFYAGGWMVTSGALLLSEGLVWVAVSTAEGVDLWALVAQVGGGIGDALTTPVGAGVLIALEVVAVLALFALHRVLRPRGSAESEEAGE